MLDLNYEVKAEIDSTPSASPTWLELCAGIKNMAESLNEVIYQASYYCGNGWGSSEVTGGQFSLALTGDRDVSDPAQNYLFSSAVKYAFGASRKSTLRITESTGVVILWDITIVTIETPRGDANQPNAINIVIHGNGAPTVTGTTAIGDLAITSVPGSLAGDTIVAVNPALTGGSTYVYKTAASVTLPTFDQDLTAWTAWNGTDEITATTGHEIVIAEVDGGLLAQKAGKTIVISA